MFQEASEAGVTPTETTLKCRDGGELEYLRYISYDFPNGNLVSPVFGVFELDPCNLIGSCAGQ